MRALPNFPVLIRSVAASTWPRGRLPDNRLDNDGRLWPATDQALEAVLLQHAVEQLCNCAVPSSATFKSREHATRGRSFLTSI